jgi:transglutaminase-like putative cysteine protease
MAWTTVRWRPRQPRGTDGTLLASLPWTLAALTFTLVPHLPHLPPWTTTTFVACAGWRLLIERRRGLLPRAWLRAVLALASFLGVFATYDAISGVGPGSTLLVLMASLKLLETRRRRDQFVLLFIAIFLVMSSLLREQYLWSLPYLAASLILIMTAWLRMADEGAAPIRVSVLLSARLVAYAAPLALAMWFFFPRLSSPFWSVPIDTSAGISGLSDTMSPGDLSSLSRSGAVAFRVRFAGAIPPPRDRYWRALVLHRFNGRTWSGREPMVGVPAAQQVEFAGTPLRYQVTLEPTRQQWVPALEMPSEWSLPDTFMQPTQALARVTPLDQRVAFEAVSHTAYRADAGLRPLMQRWYLDIPDGTNPRTRALASDLRAESASDSAFVERVLRLFHDEPFFYTLEPPALGSNPVDRFLFDTRRGFCEHYASAFTVLMRAVGVPARVVLGYQGGERNPVGDYLIVRQSDAHAWSEVWLAGQGWVRVDPTAAVAPERIELGIADSLFGGAAANWGFDAPSRLWHQVRLSWDALNANWNDWVLGYGPDKQAQFMRWLGMESPKWRNMMLTLIALVIALTLVVSALMMWRYRPPRPDRASQLYRRFVAASRLRPAIGETPANFAQRALDSAALPRDSVESIARAYHDVRYGGRPEALPELERAVAGLRRRW